MKITSLFLIPLLAVIMAYGNMSKASANPQNNTDGLVAWYPFNGNANDQSGNGNNPTYIGSGVTLTSDRFGNPGRAYYFDGNESSYIRVPADNFPTTDRTISFWFYADQLENHPTPLSYGGDVCNNSLLMIINKGDFPNAYTVLSHCGSNLISAPYSVAPVNNWYFLTMTISGATQKIFINGELLQTANSFSVPTVVSGKSVILGALLFTDGNTVYVDPTAGNFQGKMDEFRFYNTAMSDSEVQNLYNNETDGLVAYFPFNGNTDDISGNGNNGLAYNAILTADRLGVADRAYLFNGIDSYIEGVNKGTNLPTGNSSRTFIAWEKDYTYQQWGSNIFHYGTAEVAPTNFHFLVTDVLGLGNGYGYGVVYGTTNLIDSTWHFVCGTYNNTDQTVQLYVDGRFDKSEILSTAPNTILSNNWRIGLFMAGGTPFNGKLDEIRVFDKVLSDQDILDLYWAETTAPVLQQPLNQSVIHTLTPVMQWSSAFAGAEYRFQLSADSMFTAIIHEVTTTDLTTQLPEGLLTDGQTYYWRVRTTLNGETGPWSEVWRFIFMNTGLPKQIPNLVKLNINPNPVDALVKISYSVPFSNISKVPLSIEILNSIGASSYKMEEKSVWPGNYELNIETNSMQPGIYYVNLKAGNTRVVRKLVVIH